MGVKGDGREEELGEAFVFVTFHHCSETSGRMNGGTDGKMICQTQGIVTG